MRLIFYIIFDSFYTVTLKYFDKNLRSSVVQALLLEAHAKGIRFKVIVVDSRPRLEGN